ncbi:MAG TPA: helicase HerA-like domain-containing protein [Terriglobales bacterium]|nr:helicase HerA-like domain-containing protein [Terriglobales bacterium]
MTRYRGSRPCRAASSRASRSVSSSATALSHALRAFTPVEQRAVRAAAETFRPNPELALERVVQEMTVGEALVSMLQGEGEPSVTQRTRIHPPSARIGPLSTAERKAKIEASPLQRQVRERDRSMICL